MADRVWSEKDLIRRANRRLAVLQHAEEVSGNVAATCRYYGISRNVFYRWKRRYEEEGLEGLKDRSSAPLYCPTVTDPDIVEKARNLRQSPTPRNQLGRPHRSRSTNIGASERSDRIDAEEFYRLLDGVVEDDAGAGLFNQKLKEWEDYYNYHRPHGGLGGQTPYERLLQKTKTQPVTGPRQSHN